MAGAGWSKNETIALISVWGEGESAADVDWNKKEPNHVPVNVKEHGGLGLGMYVATMPDKDKEFNEQIQEDK